MSTFSVTTARAVDTHLAEVAELFVAVDVAYGCEPFWPEVRARGYDGAVALLSKPWHAVAFAVDAGQLVGFAALDRPGPHDMELVRVMTHPAAVGKGVATACVAALLEVADSDGIPVWLDVLEHAHGAIALYERLGFCTVSKQAGAHSGRPARQMRRLHPRCLAM